MGIFAKIGGIIMKGKLGAILIKLGMVSTVFVSLMAAIKWLLPSPHELIIFLCIVGGIAGVAWFAADQLHARKAKRDIEVALAQAKANAGKS